MPGERRVYAPLYAVTARTLAGFDAERIAKGRLGEQRTRGVGDRLRIQRFDEPRRAVPLLAEGSDI